MILLLFYELIENVTVFEVVESLFCLVSTWFSVPFGMAKNSNFGSTVCTLDWKNKLATKPTKTVVVKPITI